MKKIQSRQLSEDSWHGFQRRVLPGLLAIAVGLLLISNVRSQTWTGLGDNNLWNNPKNWDTEILPTAGDETRINAPGAVLTQRLKEVRKFLVDLARICHRLCDLYPQLLPETGSHPLHLSPCPAGR